jgi:DNA-binding transcriptional regulator YiaG
MKFNNHLLTKCREGKGWSINEATYQFRSFDLKVSHPTLKSWEDGQTAPDAVEVGLICVVYGRKVEDFYFNKKGGMK